MEKNGQLPPGPAIHGRGATENPENRFVKLSYEAEPGADPDEEPSATGPKTVFFRDTTRTALTRNNSPDVGFDVSVNPYRGCEHGCIYCYARPTHEYLGLSAGLDFETKIFVKEDAPELLRAELGAASWQPQLVALSGVTDPYQPIERRLRLTRRCLEVLVDCRNPVFLITKNELITRDADLLGELGKLGAAGAFLSVTTLDDELCGVLEPRTSRPAGRLRAITALARAGVSVGVNVAPVIPGLTEHELPAILQAAADAGASWASFVPLRLPYAVAPLFEAWLERHRPDRKDKVLNRVRELRGGRLNDPDFGSRMRGQGVWAQQIRNLFQLGCRRARLATRAPGLTTEHFRRPLVPRRDDPRQLTLC